MHFKGKTANKVTRIEESERRPHLIKLSEDFHRDGGRQFTICNHFVEGVSQSHA